MLTNFLLLGLVNTFLTSAQENIISGNSENFICYKFSNLQSCLETVNLDTVSLKIEDTNVPRLPR